MTKVIAVGITLDGPQSLEVIVEAVSRPGIPGLVCLGVPKAFARQFKEKYAVWCRMFHWRLPALRIIISVSPNTDSPQSLELALFIAATQALGNLPLMLSQQKIIWVGEVSGLGEVQCSPQVAASYLGFQPSDHTHVVIPPQLRLFAHPEGTTFAVGTLDKLVKTFPPIF